MGGQGYTAPSDLLNVAGIGVGSQGGGDIQQISTPDVAIVRPQRNMNGTPMSKEQIAAQEARRAEMMKQNPPPGGAPAQGAPGRVDSGRLVRVDSLIRIPLFRWVPQEAGK